jgi:hypothetical protein
MYVVLADPWAYTTHHKHAANIMITQREYVEGCQQWYREADLQPGNPEDGVWEQCHYPVPKCLGGTETVLLLKEHHAVQGVLQSEEFGHPCIYGWEKRYLDDEIALIWKKWMVAKASGPGKQNPMYGKNHKKETRDKMSKSHRGKKHLEETKQKIREANLGKTVSDESRIKNREAHLGKRATQETRQKMSAAHSGKLHHLYGVKPPESTRQ